MITTCVVCTVTNPGMINIYDHPNDLDRMLTFVTNHRVDADDYLCISCYDELKIAYCFKQKCQQSRLYRPTAGEKDLGQFANEVAELDEMSAVASSTDASPSTELHDKFDMPMDCNDDKITTTTINADEETQESVEDYLFDENVDDFAELVDTKKVMESLTTDDGHFSFNPSTASEENEEIDEQALDDEQAMKDELEDNQEDGIEIKCDLCEKTFTKKGNFYRHMSQVHGIGEKTQRMPRDRHRRGPVPHYPDDDIFRKLGERQCEYCFETLSTIEELPEHEAKHKGEERPYRCNQSGCLATFKDRYSVRYHVRIHSDEKRYKCRFCNQGFHQGGNLKAHERCHTGEKPFVCPHCGKAFAENGNLKSHIRFHTGERPYSCDFCSKKFRTHYSHKIHVRSHTLEKPFECDNCGKSFNCSGKLRIHRRIHTGHRPYKCSECDAAFMDSSRLKRHSKTHSD